MATLVEVCEHTGVAEKKIRQFIREGRLIVTSFPNLGYPCESCGTLIQMNRLCKPCKQELEGEIASLTQKNHEEKTSEQQAQQSRLNQFL